MVRYYFHFVSKADQIDDHRGVELDGPSAAHKHALGLIRKTAFSIVGQPWRDWVIQVNDAHGRSVLTVPFLPNIVPRKGFGKRRHHDFLVEQEGRLTDASAKLREGEW